MEQICEELCADVRGIIIDKLKEMETAYMCLFKNHHTEGYVLRGYIKRNIREPKGHYTVVMYTDSWFKGEIVKHYPCSEMLVWNSKMLFQLVSMLLEECYGCVYVAYKQGGLIDEKLKNIEAWNKKYMMKHLTLSSCGFEPSDYYNDSEEEEEDITLEVKMKRNIEIEKHRYIAGLEMTRRVCEMIENLI